MSISYPKPEKNHIQRGKFVPCKEICSRHCGFSNGRKDASNICDGVMKTERHVVIASVRHQQECTKSESKRDIVLLLLDK